MEEVGTRGCKQIFCDRAEDETGRLDLEEQKETRRPSVNLTASVMKVFTLFLTNPLCLGTFTLLL